MIKKTKIMPMGIKVISTYYIIVSVLTVIVGLIISLFPSKIRDYVITATPEFASIEATLAINAIMYTGIFFIIFGIFGTILGLNLFKVKNWARLTIILFTLFGFFMALMGLISGQWSNIVGLLINGFIAWYLIFNKKCKDAFKNQ